MCIFNVLSNKRRNRVYITLKKLTERRAYRDLPDIPGALPAIGDNGMNLK